MPSPQLIHSSFSQKDWVALNAYSCFHPPSFTAQCREENHSRTRYPSRPIHPIHPWTFYRKINDDWRAEAAAEYTNFTINRFFTLCWDFSFFSWAYGMVWLSSKCCGSKSIVFVFPYFLLFTTEPFGKYCGADFPNLPYFLNPFKGQEELDAKKRNKLSWESEPEGFSGAIQRGPHCLKKSEFFCN